MMNKVKQLVNKIEDKLCVYTLISTDRGTYRAKCWYWAGQFHRNGDMPAIIYDDGTMEWYRFGRRHRNNDMPAMINANGSQIWFKRGKLHRDDGPAVIIPWNDGLSWFKYDQEYQPSMRKL